MGCHWAVRTSLVAVEPVPLPVFGNYVNDDAFIPGYPLITKALTVRLCITIFIGFRLVDDQLHYYTVSALQPAVIDKGIANLLERFIRWSSFHRNITFDINSGSAAPE